MKLQTKGMKKQSQPINKEQRQEENQNDLDSNIQNLSNSLKQQSSEFIQEEELNQQEDQQQLEEQQEQENQLEQSQQEEKNNPERYKAIQSNKGVCYISRIPPYMKPNHLKKILTQAGYEIQRVYLLEETDWIRKSRVRNGGNKKVCYTQGWIEFNDKRMATLAALTLNGQKMVPKKHNFYSQDLWNLKYLAKFKWHHLTERLAHQQRIKKQRLKIQLQQQKKIQEFYEQKIHKSKFINKIIQKKLKKGRQINVNLKSGQKRRTFQQMGLVQKQKDQ